MVRVVAFTREPLVAMALRSLFSSHDDLSLCAIPSTVEELKAVIDSERPDVALVSLSKDIDFGLLTELRRLSGNTACVLWVEEMSAERAHQALECGVRGVLKRSLEPELVLKCLRKVAEGELWFEKSLTSAFLNGRSVRLTRRESQLMKLLSQGLKNKEIASALCITEGTVKVYLSKLFVKVGARDRFELALFGLRAMPYTAGTDTARPRLFLADKEPEPVGRESSGRGRFAARPV